MGHRRKRLGGRGPGLLDDPLSVTTPAAPLRSSLCQVAKPLHRTGNFYVICAKRFGHIRIASR
jgi:hypothetical protein